MAHSVLYADNILLVAPSITMLEKILHKCDSELQWLNMAIDFKKSWCLRIGPRAGLSVCISYMG